MRFLYLDDIPTPYRLAVFRAFAKKFEGTFKILFTAAVEKGRTWSLAFDDLDTEVLKGIQWNPPSQVNPFALKWNPFVSQALSKFKPDVVVVSGYVHPTIQQAMWWCRRHAVPYGIASESSFLQSSSHGLKWWLKRLIFAPSIRNASFHLPIGTKASTYLHRLGGTNMPHYFFPNTPDVDSIIREVALLQDKQRSQAFRREIGFPEKPFLLFVARLIPMKRCSDLIKAYEKLPAQLQKQVNLVIVGDGPLRPLLETQAHPLKEQIHFLGFRSPKQVHQIMALAKALVLPSEKEPWGVVVNEAMAAGTPVIASDAVGAAYDMIIEQKSGFLFPAGDVETLTKRLVQICSAEVDVEAMGKFAQAHARAFGHDFAVANLNAAIRGCTPASHTPSSRLKSHL